MSPDTTAAAAAVSVSGCRAPVVPGSSPTCVRPQVMRGPRPLRGNQINISYSSGIIQVECRSSTTISTLQLLHDCMLFRFKLAATESNNSMALRRRSHMLSITVKTEKCVHFQILFSHIITVNCILSIILHFRKTLKTNITYIIIIQVTYNIKFIIL